MIQDIDQGREKMSPEYTSIVQLKEKYNLSCENIQRPMALGQGDILVKSCWIEW